MSEISVIGNAVVGNVPATAPTTTTAPTKPAEVAAPAVDNDGVAATDHVEFSQKAQMLEKIQQLPSVRQQRIDVIKDAIATNSYVTDDKLDLAIHRMIDDIIE